MAKEWILNSAVNRFQLNFKRNVGATSENIRKCEPKTLEEWREYYFNNVKPKEHLVELGKKLYVKITEVITTEISEITEQDCIDYIIQLVIDRTFDGYQTEINTIYSELQKHIELKIEVAPDKWDRIYNVDFYIQVNSKFIGLQIKPVNEGIQLVQIYKEKEIQRKSHIKFKEKFGGNVFYIYSQKLGGKKQILNVDIIEKIKDEIKLLNS